MQDSTYCDLYFEKGLAEHEFQIFVQPKYNTFTKRITSGEALSRWRLPDGSLLSPGAFIPALEHDGRIVLLDEFVFREVCARQKQLLDSGREPVPVSVNLSRVTLFRPDSLERYRAIVEETGLPVELVPLELTESATIENSEINVLAENFRAAGFKLHMDDFGSGFSSFSGLVKLDFDVLKLDKSLIDGIGNPRGDELLRHVIELAHFFGMEVVAEGVENEHQYGFLKKLNCDTIQGYLFSPPVPFDDFLKLREARPESETELLSAGLLAEEASVGSLRITYDAKLQYLGALAGIYMTMHVIDLREDTVVEFATTTNVKEHANRVHNASAQIRAAMKATVAPEYLDRILCFTDLSTVAGRMRGKRTISDEFAGTHFGWVEARFISVVMNERDEPEKVLYTTRVLEQDKRKGVREIQECVTDELTGVGNRTACERAVRALRKTDLSDLYVLCADIDGLHEKNRLLGHAAGDELLFGAADCLNSAVGSAGTVYRTGGDSFTALFRAKPDDQRKILEEFRRRVSHWVGNNVHTLSVSFGLVFAGEYPEFTVDELLLEADRRRLGSKNKQRGEL